MLTNLENVENLGAIARQRARPVEMKSVPNSKVPGHLKEGWTTVSSGETTSRLQRAKKVGPLLEDRVWTLFYRMRFPLLSDAGGGKVLVGSQDESPLSQIDVFAMDDEIALAIECKASEAYSKRPQFQDELGKHSLLREPLTSAIKRQFVGAPKRNVVLAMFMSNVNLSDNDRQRAKQANIVLFDERDLLYYEQLTGHLGPAARYQFLADLLPNKTIPGLSIRLPAIRTKMGGYNCYTFAILPEYLLKIAYVSHRAKGKPSDVDAYQRMLTKARLNKIRKYVSDDGIFPTNIVVNFEKNRLQFERTHQDGDDQENGIAGWLTLRSAYKSAWIIDGQHRLFAYSGLPEARTGKLTVLAFEGLDPAEQARLFIDINAKQKRVKQSLLEELYSELHWGADEDSVRVSAIVSKAVQVLGELQNSPLQGRIQTSDSGRDAVRCISLNSLFRAISKSALFIVKEKHDKVLEYGPFWTGDNDATLKRTIEILSAWFESIRDAVPDWWDKGSGEGGGLAMNDGVTACILVMRSVCTHLLEHRLIGLTNTEVVQVLSPYAKALGKHLASLSEDQRRSFRELRGGQGQGVRMRMCQAGIRKEIASFNPAGLDEFLEKEKLQTNQQAKSIMDNIERLLKKTVLEELKAEFGSSEFEWWMQGVPIVIRKRINERFEEDRGERGGKENYFDLLDYFKIAVDQWRLFEPLLSLEKSGKKEQRLGWIEKVNKFRNAIAHPSSGVMLSVEDLGTLESYERILIGKLKSQNELSDVSSEDLEDSD